MQKYIALAHPSKSILKRPLFWLALAMLALSMLFWMLVLSAMPVGKAYPMLSVNYVLILLLSWRLFNEPIPPGRLGGVLLIVTGVIVMGAS